MMFEYSLFTLKVSIDQGFLLTARVTQVKNFVDKCHNLRFASASNIVKTTTKLRWQLQVTSGHGWGEGGGAGRAH